MVIPLISLISTDTAGLRVPPIGATAGVFVKTSLSGGPNSIWKGELVVAVSAVLDAEIANPVPGLEILRPEKTAKPFAAERVVSPVNTAPDACGRSESTMVLLALDTIFPSESSTTTVN